MVHLSQRFRRIPVYVTLIFAIAAIVALFSPYVDPMTNWLYSFFALIFPWVLLANVGLAIYWGYRKKWMVLIPALVALYGFYSPGNIFQYHRQLEAGQNQPGMTVMSYNIHGLAELRRDKDEIATREKQFADFMTKHQPDIILAQECSGTNMETLADILGYDYYTTNPQKKPLSTAIISRYPILQSDQENFYQSTNSYTWADIRVKDTIYRFFSLHLESNFISTEAKLLSDDSDILKEETRGRIRKIMALYRLNTRKRAYQAKVIRKLVDKSPYPTIIAGDFNDPPLANSYHSLSKGYQDSFIERGHQYGVTYGGLIPTLRIDYILVPPSLKVLKHQVPKVPYSDHYPVLCELSWQN